jgi:hypothetical protein
MGWQNTLLAGLARWTVCAGTKKYLDRAKDENPMDDGDGRASPLGVCPEQVVRMMSPER